jgi:hypothetical protein
MLQTSSHMFSGPKPRTTTDLALLNYKGKQRVVVGD